MAISLIRSGLRKKKKKEQDRLIRQSQQAQATQAPQETKVKEEETPKEEEKPKGSGKRKITFGDKIGDDVKVETEGGTEEPLTREEYKRFNEQLGRGSQRLEDAGSTERVKNLLNITRENQRALMLQQGQGTNLNQTNQTQMQGQGMQGQINPNIPSSLYNYKEDNSLYQGFLSMDSKKAQMLQDATELKGGQLKSGLNIAQATFGLFIDLIDNLAKVATLGALGKDTMDVKNAKENMNLAKQAIERQIALVPTGEVNVYELHEAVKMYRANLNYLESTNKRIGLDNFAYWITDGRNLEQEIFNKNSEFAELERMLQLARMQNLQNSLLNQQMQLQ
jgi:hypothetical protein